MKVNGKDAPLEFAIGDNKVIFNETVEFTFAEAREICQLTLEQINIHKVGIQKEIEGTIDDAITKIVKENNNRVNSGDSVVTMSSETKEDGTLSINMGLSKDFMNKLKQRKGE